jgi:DNA end-binding protein Ku
MWKGSLAFGLVNIPVELYSATRDHRPKFRLLHAKDEEPVRYERVCQKEGKPVAWEDLVKGYEYAKGSSSSSRRTTSRPPRSRRRRRSTFSISSIPQKWTSWSSRRRTNLLPREGGRPRLRAPARSDSRVRKDRHLQDDSCATRSTWRRSRPIGDALVLTMMRFTDELADLKEFNFPRKAEIRPAEMKMAQQLIGNLVTEWDPAKYSDEYKENLLRVINAKVKGKKPRLVGEDTTPKQAEVVDLMARLRASLEGKKSRRARDPRRRRRHLKGEKSHGRVSAWRRTRVQVPGF